MTTAELIALLHASDPTGTRPVAIERVEWPTDGSGGIERRLVYLTRLRLLDGLDDGYGDLLVIAENE